MNIKHLEKALAISKHLINVSYFIIVTYRDLTGFLVQAPPLPSEYLRGQRDLLVQSHNLISFTADKDANYLYSIACCLFAFQAKQHEF